MKTDDKNSNEKMINIIFTNERYETFDNQPIFIDILNKIVYYNNVVTSLSISNSLITYDINLLMLIYYNYTKKIPRKCFVIDGEFHSNNNAELFNSIKNFKVLKEIPITFSLDNKILKSLLIFQFAEIVKLIEDDSYITKFLLTSDIIYYYKLLNSNINNFPEVLNNYERLLTKEKRFQLNSTQEFNKISNKNLKNQLLVNLYCFSYYLNILENNVPNDTNFQKLNLNFDTKLISEFITHLYNTKLLLMDMENYIEEVSLIKNYNEIIKLK